MRRLKELVLKLRAAVVDFVLAGGFSLTFHGSSMDTLIRAKRAMGRARDLHAVLELETIREKLLGSQ